MDRNGATIPCPWQRGSPKIRRGRLTSSIPGYRYDQPEQGCSVLWVLMVVEHTRTFHVCRPFLEVKRGLEGTQLVQAILVREESEF